jgi:hypothetical protein
MTRHHLPEFETMSPTIRIYASVMGGAEMAMIDLVPN